MRARAASISARGPARIALFVTLALAGGAALALPGCAGCENTVCCALEGHALPRVLRPSGCSAMSGTPVAPAMCDVVCCEATDGTHAPGSRATCTHVVDPLFCDAPDGG